MNTSAKKVHGQAVDRRVAAAPGVDHAAGRGEGQGREGEVREGVGAEVHGRALWGWSAEECGGGGTHCNPSANPKITRYGGDQPTSGGSCTSCSALAQPRRRRLCTCTMHNPVAGAQTARGRRSEGRADRGRRSRKPAGPRLRSCIAPA